VLAAKRPGAGLLRRPCLLGRRRLLLRCHAAHGLRQGDARFDGAFLVFAIDEQSLLGGLRLFSRGHFSLGLGLRHGCRRGHADERADRRRQGKAVAGRSLRGDREPVDHPLHSLDLLDGGDRSVDLPGVGHRALEPDSARLGFDVDPVALESPRLLHLGGDIRSQISCGCGSRRQQHDDSSQICRP